MIELKSIGGTVLYTATSATDVKAALVEAVKAKTYLGGAYLGGADLRGAYLGGAYLRGADLGGAYLGGAYLRGADLRGADLGGAYLRGAYLRGAYLRGADLGGAYLGGADLGGADLGGAYLGGADLGGAYLGGADLGGAYLGGADLGGAYLRGADLGGATNAKLAIAQTRILPDGDIIGWKKCQNKRVVQLRIPAAAKRSHASGRKCRAEYAEVVAIFDDAGNPVDSATSQHDQKFVYEPGVTVRPTEPFDDDMWNECASGIHFYITRDEAVAHV